MKKEVWVISMADDDERIGSRNLTEEELEYVCDKIFKKQEEEEMEEVADFVV